MAEAEMLPDDKVRGFPGGRGCNKV